MPLEMKWWQECLHDAVMGAIVPWDSWVAVADVYDAYKVWARQFTSSHRLLDKIEFGRRMNRLLSAESAKPKRINGQTVQAISVRPLADARRAFDHECDTATTWPDAQGATVQTSVPF